MPQYELDTRVLMEADSNLRGLAGQLNETLEQLNSVLERWPENLLDLRQRLSGEISAIDEAATFTNKIAGALMNVVITYLQAERTTFPGGGGGMTRDAALPVMQTLPIRETPGLLLTNDLLMQDWLQTDVLEYMQSQYDDATEGSNSNEL